MTASDEPVRWTLARSQRNRWIGVLSCTVLGVALVLAAQLTRPGGFGPTIPPIVPALVVVGSVIVGYRAVSCQLARLEVGPAGLDYRYGRIKLRLSWSEILGVGRRPNGLGLQLADGRTLRLPIPGSRRTRDRTLGQAVPMIMDRLRTHRGLPDQ